jgi:hypothetical protein
MSQMGKYKDMLKQMENKKQGLTESKKFVDSKYSMANHIMAYKHMTEQAAPQQTKQKVEIKEDCDLKMVGALQVVKEILSNDISANPKEILSKVKTILNDFQ